ncbi:LacI family DNA-binding transcriptional regulator [Microbacterium schleiferi]|uniref:LacI family DNA-binding transcriptional regulator n=1 Tax=Microbacterium schleiferi TaxID=69362 RepID=A0A7S8MY59_9MICO|nr:LacI family DNA-binding transcriptional regulator [Microbacterium schleiferi]QPE04848.1 LacI family DNA-binding transcriptional regulator [Microbacterium schleiferi]
MAVSVKDVAAAASVSIGTVSNVLNQPSKVSAATVERVMRAIDELGFVRNDAARQLRAGRSRSIGLIAPDMANPFFAAVAQGAQERAAEAGMFVLMTTSNDTLDREKAYLDLFREQRVAGVLVTPASADPDAAGRLARTGIPVVLLDREATDARLCSVSVDDEQGGYLAASHLLSLGRRRLAFLGGSSEIPQVAERLAGAQRAVAEAAGAGLELIETPELTVIAGREASSRLARRAPGDRPDAVFCANDLVAVGALQGLSILGDLRVPDDIALIGYDDIDFAAAAVVPLSSIRQPAAQIGRAAVEILLAEMSDPGGAHDTHVRFTPELIVRESTAG